jgi:hypothetical protein
MNIGRLAFNSIHFRWMVGWSSRKVMRHFFCYRTGRKRRESGVKVRKNSRIRFTCDTVDNESDTAVIILPGIVCVRS